MVDHALPSDRRILFDADESQSWSVFGTSSQTRLDGNHAPIEQARGIATNLPYGIEPSATATGDRFAVSWDFPGPHVVIMNRDGATTAPVDLAATPERRRTARH
jgi:hypothetical protein